MPQVSHYLRDLARAELAKRRTLQLRKAIDEMRPLVPHDPSPVQRLFLELDVLEALYGGAAGGGKTDAVLMGALQHFRVPGYSAVILRRDWVDHLKEGSALTLANAWLPDTGAKWAEDEKAWRWPGGGSIHFGYAQNLVAMRKAYEGSAYQYIAFDELGQWPEHLYRFMFSRLRRRQNIDVPLRMRAATNPGGIGHAWVKARFVEQAKHVERGSDARKDVRGHLRGEPIPMPRVYESPPSDDTRRLAEELGLPAKGAHFVPAFVSDNPGLDGTGYKQSLARLDIVTRAQLEGGDWDVIGAGNLFKAEWFRFLKAPPVGMKWIRSWDFAATAPDPKKDPDYTVGTKLAAQALPTKEKNLIIGHVLRFQDSPGTTQSKVQTQAKLDGRLITQLMEQEPGSSGKIVIHNWKTQVLFGHHVVGFPKTGPKEEYWRPVSSLAEAGGVYLVEAPWNAALIEELVNIPVGHDDQADTLGQGLAYLADKGGKAARSKALVGG